MKGLFEELQFLMGKYRFKPSKKLSQNFLVSEAIIEKIIESAELESNDLVLEVGCGTGFLTRELLKHCSVAGFEIDSVLQELLAAEIQSQNFQLFRQNFLKAEIPKFSKIVSAPPYSVSSDLMHLLFKQNFKLGVLLFEDVFVEKIQSMPGFKDYCSTAVLSQYFFTLEDLGNAHSDCFFPKPKTDSKILRITSSRNFGNSKNDILFEGFVEQLFRYKNKNLSNALQHSDAWIKAKLKTTNSDLEKLRENSELMETKVYLLEVEEFVKSFNALCRQ